MGAPGQVKQKYAHPGIPDKMVFNFQNPLLLPSQKKIVLQQCHIQPTKQFWQISAAISILKSGKHGKEIKICRKNTPA
jgi:hypothetical protein